MIMYKVNDPDRTLQVPTIIWDIRGNAGLDEISIGNEWHITNVGNATALWNPAQEMVTVTINFNDTTPGKDVAVTVTTNERDTTGVGIHVFVDDEWQEAINAAVQGTMFTYFVDNGDWTLNDNGLKGSSAPGFVEAIRAEETGFENGDSVGVIDALD